MLLINAFILTFLHKVSDQTIVHASVLRKLPQERCKKTLKIDTIRDIYPDLHLPIQLVRELTNC